MAFLFERDQEMDGVILITPFYTSDTRGDFTKYYEKAIFRENGIIFDVTEEFVTTSVNHVIRGLHFQTKNPQAKLVTVIEGAIFDVVVDLRLSSPTFGYWKSYNLTAEKRASIYVPKGFAHGFLTFGDINVVLYKCDAPYHQQSDGGIVWHDSDLDIKWPIGLESPIVSEKDMALQKFCEFQATFGGF